jgi:putative colanic acid biosynthesis UDP-glucose lipid carrier transferase
MLRHAVKPGITGCAQIHGWRGETDTLDKMEKRIEYDLWYIRNWSFWLDIRIILMTVIRGFYDKSAY